MNLIWNIMFWMIIMTVHLEKVVFRMLKMRTRARMWIGNWISPNIVYDLIHINDSWVLFFSRCSIYPCWWIWGRVLGKNRFYIVLFCCNIDDLSYITFIQLILYWCFDINLLHCLFLVCDMNWRWNLRKLGLGAISSHR